MGIIKAIYFLVRAFFVCRLSRAAENLTLRQQVAVYEQSMKRSKLRPRDRFFWSCSPGSGPTGDPRFVGPFVDAKRLSPVAVDVGPPFWKSFAQLLRPLVL
jgi:hypothetical protein